MGKLNGSVAVVTGASSGIGWATALALAGEGATVAVLARRSEKLRELVAEIDGAGGRAFPVAVDITDSEQTAAAMDRVAGEAGRIDVVVNSAGVARNGPVETASVDAWRQMVDVNVLGVMHSSHAALPHLLKAAEGSRGVADLVNISSVAGRTTRVTNGVYAATKHAVGAFSESLRKEVTSRHVRVCVVEPGMVRTEMTSTMATPDNDFTWLEAEDIADAVSYAVTRPRRVAVNELLVRPTEQER